MENRFNVNEEINRNKELMGMLNEQINPEDRVTETQCVGTDTPKVVLDIFEDITRNHDYECVGVIESTPSNTDDTIREILLKKNIQGVIIYVYINILEWGGLKEVGDISYYIPGTTPGDSVFYKGEEGWIKQLGDLERLEDKILDSI